MTILPIKPAEDASPEALKAFLGGCRAKAAEDGAPVLASISLVVPALDPLAVLEAIFDPKEPHFYSERPSIASAIAGAEIALSATASGPGRFAAVQKFIDETLARTVAVGDVNAPFGGPHFFTTFAFQNEVEPGEPFPAARVFVPSWQVARAGEVTTAVANIVVEAGSDLDALTQRVWRAHGRFARFEFGSGTGVPPAGLGSSSESEITGGTPVPLGQNHGRDARATLASVPTQVRWGAYLPHWSRDGAVYSVTFRLADSLPAEVVDAWREERRELELRALQAGRKPKAEEVRRLTELGTERIEAFLDSALGACWLRNDAVAQIVRDALFHFAGDRYELHAWCVMPNHVHLVIEPTGRWSLAEILHSVKSFTAKRANAVLGREGEFWQAEYYDHLVRDEADYERAVHYALGNPAKAGLSDWRWVGQGSGTGVPPAGLGSSSESEITGGTPLPLGRNHGRDARATPIQFTQRETGDYANVVARGLERIAAGEFEKIVLARAIDLEADRPLHPLTVLNGLRQRFPDCYAFSAAGGSGASFIGAAPERLVRVSQGMIETEALAGSARRGASASEDAALAAALQRSEKDLREHRHVIGSILRRVETLGVRLDFSETPGLRKLANVQHLHTPMRAPLPVGVRLLDLVAVLHPTPAVGGTPRAAAVAAIRGLEGFPRGLYAGALGWINARGGGEFFVGLRSALVEGAKARVYAGAGIVAGSEPEREFGETELKFQALLAALRG
jgi:menaquinone-specific isochorismate synthase